MPSESRVFLDLVHGNSSRYGQRSTREGDSSGAVTRMEPVVSIALRDMKHLYVLDIVLILPQPQDVIAPYVQDSHTRRSVH